MRTQQASSFLAVSILVAGLALPASALAQDQPFVFSISTSQPDKPAVRMRYDAGVGEQAFDVVESDRAEQRLGVQAFLGRGWTVAARVGFSIDDRDARSSQQAEVLYNVLHGPESGIVALGLGMRHEAAGVNVLTGRVAAGRAFSSIWRLDGNLVFEKPFSVGRDAIDLMTTIGFARRVSSTFYLGVEGVGEDLEGFWDPREAEGGARLLIGPSIRFVPVSAKWQVSVAGGPILRATDSNLTSGALRALRTSGERAGYAVRAALGYGF